jgi:ATP-binding cassette subfamily B protein
VTAASSKSDSGRGPRHAWRTGLVAWALVRGAARRELWLSIVLTLIGAILAAAELLVGRRLVELVTDEQAATDATDLVPWLVALAVLLVGSALVSAAVAELRILLNELVHRRAIDEVLVVATAAELEDFEDSEFHDEVQRAREHADTYAWQTVWGLVTLLSTLFTSIAVGAVLLSVAPTLLPIALLAYVPLAIVGVLNTRLLYDLRYELAELDRDRAYHERLLTSRADAKEVRAFGLTDWLRHRHDVLFERRVENTRRVVVRRTALTLVGSTLTAVVIVVTLGVVLILAVDDRISVADAAVAVVALRQLSSRLELMGSAFISMFEGVTFVRDFETFRQRAADKRVRTGPPPELAVAPPRRPERIVLEGVSYRYPTAAAEALHQVDLRLEPGRVVAVVGPNGSGKTTLAKLLCGLLPPTDGRIVWDDVDAVSCASSEVRGLVAPVFQDFARFEHSAREAIGFGDLSRLEDQAAVEEAARRAGADGFIDRLSAGYDTRLSTSFAGGTELSHGQWQRLAIARAFLRDAPLVVMDEPAASLDPLGERELFARLNELGRDRAVVFISHRFATVRRADHIVFLLEGRVVEEGSHDELVAGAGLYAELYELQADQFRSGT